MLSQALPSRARHILLPYARSSRPRHGDEEGRAIKVTVWWDLVMCRLPPGASPVRFAPRVTAALRGAGIRGPVEINAFGDVSLLSRDEQVALADTGVTISHVPSGVKGSCDPSFMADIIYWISQNPPPAHFFLISGDKEFSNILHRLRMSNYNILLACPEVGSKMLRSAATMMWPWEALVKEVDLTPKHVNQPPDDSSNSWYGRYRGPVDIQLLKSKDLAALPQNTKMPKAPRFVIMGVKKVLRFYPEGISLPNLRAELEKANIRIDRGFFGFKKFSGLLQAMPDVVKFIDPLPGDCQPAVVGVVNTSVEPSEQDFNRMDSSRSSVEDKHICETESEELSWASHLSSSESPCTQKQTLEADVPSLPLDQLSSIQKTTPDLTTRAEPNSSHVEPDVSLATDVSSSDALSRDQRNTQTVDLPTETEPQINHTEAHTVAAAGTPTSGAQGSIIGKKGLLERILSLWNGPAH